MIRRFVQWNIKNLPILNKMVDIVNSLDNMRGDSFINVTRSAAGTNISLNKAEVTRRIRLSGGGGGGASMAFVKDPPGAVTTVVCFLGTDLTGPEITVNCSVIGGNESEKLNEAVPPLTTGSIIFIEQFGADYWCVSPFTARDDCDCVQPDHVFNSIAVASDEKISLDGVLDGDTFIRHNSADDEVEHAVEGDTVTKW